MGCSMGCVSGSVSGMCPPDKASTRPQRRAALAAGEPALPTLLTLRPRSGEVQPSCVKKETLAKKLSSQAVHAPMEVVRSLAQPGPKSKQPLSSQWDAVGRDEAAAFDRLTALALKLSPLLRPEARATLQDCEALEAQLRASSCFLAEELPALARRLNAPASEVLRASQGLVAVEVRLPIMPRRRRQLDFSRLTKQEMDTLLAGTSALGEVLAPELLDRAAGEVAPLREALQAWLEFFGSLAAFAKFQGTSLQDVVERLHVTIATVVAPSSSRR